MRPSIRELFRKIRISKEIFLTDGENILLIDPGVIAEDAIELGYQISKIKSILSEIFNEIKPEHYAGQRPPQRSYEVIIKNMELFAFRWMSKKFGCETYIKFALKNDIFYLVSLHEDRPKK